MSLLLLTGAAGMFVGARGLPAWGTFAATMLGLALACGGAVGAQPLPRPRHRPADGRRTEARPVASGRVAPAYALEFGLALSAFSFTLLAATVNVLTALLALVGNLFYVLVYTRVLKRPTVQNIVIGGAAGAVPPLVGYAAATGNLADRARAVRDRLRLDAAALLGAGAADQGALRGGEVPMLPVVRATARPRGRSPCYSVALVAVTLVPVASASSASSTARARWRSAAIHLARARGCGATRRGARAVLFHYSLLYLACSSS